MVTSHFGHCQSFMLFNIKDKKIIEKRDVPNPGHKKGFLPIFLKDLGVNLIISGGMGGGAIDLFKENNIEVITGATGCVEDIVDLYLSDDLVSKGSICNEHHFHGNCD